MAVVAKLEILTVANTGQLTGQFSKGTVSVMGFGKSLMSTMASANLLSGAITKMASSAMQAVRSMVASVKSALESIDATNKLASSLGFLSEAFIGLAHAANLAGMSGDEFSNAMTKMTDSIGAAFIGSNAAARDAFEALGISVDALSKMTGEERLFALADAIQKVGWNAKSVAALADIFGRRVGPDMLQLLGEGSAGLKAYIADAKLLGITFDTISGAKVEAANDAWTRLKSAFKGVGNVIAIELTPAMKYLSDAMVDLKMKTTSLGSVINMWWEGVKTITLTSVKVILFAAQKFAQVFLGAALILSSAFAEIANGLEWMGLVAKGTTATIESAVRRLDAALAELANSSWADDFENGWYRAKYAMEDAAAATVKKRAQLSMMGFGIKGDVATKATPASVSQAVQPAAAMRGTMEAAIAILTARSAGTAAADQALKIARESLKEEKQQVAQLRSIDARLSHPFALYSLDLQ